MLTITEQQSDLRAVDLINNCYIKSKAQENTMKIQKMVFYMLAASQYLQTV